MIHLPCSKPGGHWLRIKEYTRGWVGICNWTRWAFPETLNWELWSSWKWSLKMGPGEFLNSDTRRWGAAGQGWEAHSPSRIASLSRQSHLETAISFRNRGNLLQVINCTNSCIEKIENVPNWPPHFHLLVPITWADWRLNSSNAAYAWVKCEWEEDEDCFRVMRSANITGRAGPIFKADNHYVRLSLIRGDDDFELLINHLNKLISGEGDAFEAMWRRREGNQLPVDLILNGDCS